MNGPMYLALCDDQPEDARVIGGYVRQYLDKHDYNARLEVYPSGEALLADRPEKYSLVILDIFMGEINGMDTAKALLEKNPRVQILFASTSIDFAAEAFAIEALYYIVKPVERERLYKVLDKFFDGYYAMKTIEVKVGRQEEHVYLSEILYVEADGKRSRIHLKQGVLETSQSLAQMGEMLPPEEFCSPIRWALVSMREITAVPGAVVRLSDGTEIPVSRGKRQQIQDAYAAFRWARIRRRMGGSV